MVESQLLVIVIGQTPVLRSLPVQLSRLLFEEFRDGLMIGLGLSRLNEVCDGHVVMFHRMRGLRFGGGAERG